MKTIIKTILFCSVLLLTNSCLSTQQVEPDSNDIKLINTRDYNVHFIGYDTGITDPDNDRHAFYKIYIDKVEEGRTTTGLESQQKTFKMKLEHNRHLLKIEKWVLDDKEKKYKKLNNIHQPRPDYIYFTVKEDQTVIIKLESRKKRKAHYSISYE